MAALAREWGQNGTGHGSLHFCTCGSPPKHGTRDTGTRDTMPPYSSFVLFLLSSSLPLHYLASLKLPLSSRPNLTKQHSTSQRWLYNKRFPTVTLWGTSMRAGVGMERTQSLESENLHSSLPFTSGCATRENPPYQLP